MTERINLPVVPVPVGGKPLPRERFFDLPPADRLDSQSAVQAIYMHVPFCTTKCHYCDFYSLAGHLEQIPRFLAAINCEMQLQTTHFGTPEPETIFIGGGTPTLLPPEDLAALLTNLRKSVKINRVKEFTTEANPNTFDQVRAEILAEAGVNRVSFGAQSFHLNELKTLQRDHDPECVPLAISFARKAGISNINIDLIFGIPGQTLASLRQSLHRAIELHPAHISCYSLVYEPNTPMTARLKSGQIAPMDENLELEMFDMVRDTLAAAGLNRYEVSNFARSGFECQHNLNYWRGQNYLAWGPAAAGHHSGYRWKNVPSLMRYATALLDYPSRLPITQMERLVGAARWGERAMLALRLTEGLNLAAFGQTTGLDAVEILAGVLKKYEGLGLLEVTDSRLRLTARAVAVSDTIMGDVLAAFEGYVNRGSQAFDQKKLGINR